jgi:hypothetical protein
VERGQMLKRDWNHQFDPLQYDGQMPC